MTVKVGIASSMWRGLADMPFPEYVAYCQQAGAEVIELSGWPQSYGGLRLDAEGLEQIRKLTRQAGIEVIAIGSPDDFVQPTADGMAEQVKLVKGFSYSPVLLFVLPTGQELHVHLHGPSQHMHMAIEVADFEATVKRLRETGVKINGPDRRGDGSEFLFCQDPDGNRIEITHHYTWQPAKLVGNG